MGLGAAAGRGSPSHVEPGAARRELTARRRPGEAAASGGSQGSREELLGSGLVFLRHGSRLEEGMGLTLSPSLDTHGNRP